MPARKLGANFSSMPHIGKLKALMCSATPRLGTSTWLPMKWLSGPSRIGGPSCSTLLLGRSLPPMEAYANSVPMPPSMSIHESDRVAPVWALIA